ncbi:MAG: hypothetical protein LBV26_05960 [Bacteroidales bacterium]|jgi:hypothetical protein|nr:hypothetical protein [Bacteroidales bacterium]
MRKNIFVITVLLLFCGCLCGQYKSITIPAGTRIIDNFPPSVRYLYPQFVQGEIVMKNGIYTAGMINYNMLHDEIDLLHNNDTVTLIKKQELRYVIADSDTFIYMPGYAKLIYGQQLKIYCRDRFFLKDILEKGAFGVPNRTAAIGQYSDTAERGIPYDLVLNEDMVFKREVAYYIATSSGIYRPFKKKNILSLFSHNKADVKKYIKTYNINLEKQEDIIKLAEFLSKL